MGGPRGGEEDPDSPPPEKHKNIGFFLQYWSGSPKMRKLPSQHSMSGHHRHASERFAGGPMMAHLLCYLDPLIKNCKVGAPLAKFS